VHRVLAALSAISISGLAGCNALLHIEDDANVGSDGGTEAGGTSTTGADPWVLDGIDSGADVGSEACDNTATNEAGDCWYCEPQCPSPVCQQNACLLLIPYPSNAAMAGTGFGTQFRVFGLDAGIAQLAGVQIHVTAPGVLMRLGMLAAYGGVQGYLGLYTNEGGGPGTRIAATGEFEVVGATVYSNPQPTIVDVIHPVALAPDYYWILGIWRSDIWFETISGTVPDCADGCTPWYELPVPYGLPDVAVPEQTMQRQPIPYLFVEVAQ
jgi:hypothetical protein